MWSLKNTSFDICHVCTLRAQTQLLRHFADCPQQCTLFMWMCCVHCHCTECHECIGVQSGKVQELVLIISFLLFYWTPNVRLKSLRPGLIMASPCLRVITAFTTQSNLPDLSFFCPTLITSLQGFYDQFLSYSSPLCFTGNSNEV